MGRSGWRCQSESGRPSPRLELRRGGQRNARSSPNTGRAQERVIVGYGNTDDQQSPERRYSPAQCIGAIPTVINGRPDPEHISTSFVERQNWTVRTTMRRYTRLSNGFSRKIENHMAAVAINYFAYNFIKIHSTLRTSPAMAAGVTDRLFDMSDLVALLVESESKKAA